MGIFNKIRGGAGSNHYSGRNDYPYAGDGSPAPQMYTWGNQPPKNEPRPNSDADDWANESAGLRPSSGTKAPQSNAGSAQPTPSGRGRYLLKGGGYVRTTPTAGKEGRHDVTTYSDDHKPQYSVSDASFHHDEETGTASFFGGVDYSSGQRMAHKWEKPTWSGNLHRDDEFGG